MNKEQAIAPFAIGDVVTNWADARFSRAVKRLMLDENGWRVSLDEDRDSWLDASSLWLASDISKMERAMEEYAANTTPGNTWIEREEG